MDFHIFIVLLQTNKQTKNPDPQKPPKKRQQQKPQGVVCRAFKRNNS